MQDKKRWCNAIAFSVYALMFTIYQSHLVPFGYHFILLSRFISPQGPIKLFNFKLFTRSESVACYHCGERVATRSVVKMPFNGKQRDLCCHGCEAVLMLVEANGLTDEYLSGKSGAEPITS